MDKRPVIRSEIAERFRALRRKEHLSQRTLGERIGICRQSVSEIENALVKPHLRTWRRFCELEERSARPLVFRPRRIIFVAHEEPNEA